MNSNLKKLLKKLTLIFSLKKIKFFCLIIFLPLSITHAEIRFTEIMYDLPGSDTKKEWVELTNFSELNFNLENYRFLENGVAHKLQGDNFILQPNQSFIIADSVSEFFKKYPNYIGLIFDSSFSLKNTGEELSLINKDKDVIAQTSYSNQFGASGDGYSLHLSGSSWKSSEVNPGFFSTDLMEIKLKNKVEEKTEDFSIDIEIENQPEQSVSININGQTNSENYFFFFLWIFLIIILILFWFFNRNSQ